MTTPRVAVSSTDDAPDLIPGVDRDASGALIPFEQAVEPRRRLTWEEIEAISLGVTLETAQECLAKLRSLGVWIDRCGGVLKHWGLYDTELHFLGLKAPSPFVWGSTTDPHATSAWWSRNHQFEAARCAPPF